MATRRLRREGRRQTDEPRVELLISPSIRVIDRPGRREYFVASSTVATTIANKVATGLLDRFLVLTGYKSQQGQRARRLEGQGPVRAAPAAELPHLIRGFFADSHLRYVTA